MDKVATSSWIAAWVIGPLALALLAACPADGAPVPCPGDDGFAVEPGHSALAPRLCEMAPPLRDAMTDCGLTQSRVLTVEVVAGLTKPFDTCLAHFDCRSDRIRIVDPASYPDLLIKDTVYSRLPEDVLLRALLTHEMAHALTFQASGDREMDIVDLEYIAAAMELELMEPKWRDVLIEAAPVSLPPKEGLIDVWIYGMAPRKFAVNAWRHFSLPTNGCGLIRLMVEGEASFSKAARPDLR